MEKNNFPQVDISDVRRKYSLVDVSRLEFKEPSNSDELQSREFYGDEETIEGLKSSILERGLLESPIVMEPEDADGKYRVLEGNRRCYAISLLIKDGVVSTNSGKALTKIRCELRPSKLTMVEEFFQEWLALNQNADEAEQQEVREHILKEVMSQLGSDALVRNTQRLNWNAMEQARAIRSLLDAGLSMDQVSKNCSLAENTIKARLSLLNKESEMPEVIEAIDRGEISFHVGKILSNVKDVETRKEVLQDAIQGASGSDIKAKINQRQEDAQKEGKVIKAQHRKKDTATKASVSPLGVRKDKELLEAVSKLSTERNTLAALEDEVSANSVLDIEIALKVLQWVLNPSDTTDVVTLLLGLNQD
jgi:ParB-like chromosome segregation protein Spo0J